MNKKPAIMKSSLLFICLSAMVEIASAQVNLKFDFSNVENTIAFLKKENPGTREIDSFLATDGVQAIIKKINANDSIARSALTRIGKGGKAEGAGANFQYEFIKSNLAALEKFMDSIKTNRHIIRDSVEALAAYLPGGKSIDVTVCFLLGGYSSGFTFSEDSIFYIGTHQYKYDFSSIVNTCQHEIFHNIQNLYHKRGPVYQALEKDTAALYVFYLAHNFFTEGVAEYVADLDKADPLGPNIKLLKEHAAVNKNRMADNFYLADRLLLDVYRQPSSTDPGAVYSILFDWNWNNPGYAIGKYMMSALAKEYGYGAVKKYLAADPLLFIRDYIRLNKTKTRDYPYGFSTDFEAMIEAVLIKTTPFH